MLGGQEEVRGRVLKAGRSLLWLGRRWALPQQLIAGCTSLQMRMMRVSATPFCKQ